MHSTLNLAENSGRQSPTQEGWSDTSDTSPFSVARGDSQTSQSCNYGDRIRYPPLVAKSSRVEPCLARKICYSSWRGMPQTFAQGDESDGDYTDDEKHGAFRRQYGIRQSERPNTKYEYDFDTQIFRGLQRNKTCRRSFNPPRNVKFNLRHPEEPVPVVVSNPQQPKKVPKSKLISLWRKLTGSSSKYKEAEHLKNKVVLTSKHTSSNDGIKYGNEISIVVCGEAKVGKSSLLENIAIAVGLSDEGHILMNKQEFRNQKHARKMQPNAITVKWKHGGEFFLVKIFEMDISVQDSYTHGFLKSCDAAILVIAKSNANSMLTSINTSKLLLTHQLPFVFVNNQFGSEKSEKSCLRKLVERMSAACFEMDLGKAENISLQVIETCIQSVLMKRNQIANIWGANL